MKTKRLYRLLIFMLTILPLTLSLSKGGGLNRSDLTELKQKIREALDKRKKSAKP